MKINDGYKNGSFYLFKQTFSNKSLKVFLLKGKSGQTYFTSFGNTYINIMEASNIPSHF